MLAFNYYYKEEPNAYMAVEEYLLEFKLFYLNTRLNIASFQNEYHNYRINAHVFHFSHTKPK